MDNSAAAEPATNNIKTFRDIPCADCDRTITVEIPSHNVLNGPRMSVLVLNHPNLTICQCGARYAVAIEPETAVQYTVRQMARRETPIIPVTM